MSRLLRSFVLAAFCAPLAIATARPAAAQERRIETAAREAMKRAAADFSAGSYDDGLARILKATRACGTVRCSAPTRAALLRDAGVLQLRRGAPERASQLFVEALQLDSRIDLPRAYELPDIRAAWDAAKGGTPGGSEPVPSGDFTPAPVVEQTEGMPVPIYVEYTGNDAIAKVVAKYKTARDPDWKTLFLTKLGRGYGGLVPCGDVKLGELRYYVQGFDAGGTPVALSGNPKQSYRVTIRQAIVGAAPSLPGRAPPAKCAPGTEAEVATETVSRGPAQCIDDSQCNGGVCNDGHCAEPEQQREAPQTFARFWVGLSLSSEVTFLPGGSDVCKLTSAGAATGPYSCTNPDGSDYPTRQATSENDALPNGGAGSPKGGPTWGDLRVLASLDYAFTANLLAGVRVGAVLGGYPASAAADSGRAFRPPVQIEIRGTYLFGENALARVGFAPLVFVDGGVGKFDAATPVTVTPTNVPGSIGKTAWDTSGPGFAGAGAGVRYQFSPRIAFNADVKIAFAFGGNGVLPSLGPEVALQYGL